MQEFIKKYSKNTLLISVLLLILSIFLANIPYIKAGILMPYRFIKCVKISIVFSLINEIYYNKS